MRIRDWRIAFAFLLLCGWVASSWASCPLLTHDNADDQREFQNVCQAIINPTIQNAVISSATISNLKGVTNASNACAGCVGEYISSVFSDISFPTSSQFGDATSISLAAGDWDIFGQIVSSLNGATITDNEFGITTTSGNSATGIVTGDNEMRFALPTSTNLSGGSVYVRVSISATTTYYLKYFAAYTSGPPHASGKIAARRVR